MGKDLSTVLIFLMFYCAWVLLLMFGQAMLFQQTWIITWGSVRLVDILSICIIAPIWEEALYRYGPLEIAKRTNKNIIFPTVVITSLLFGWNHDYGLWGIFYQGVLGFCCSAVYLLNKNSYLSTVLFHSAWNFLAVFIFDNFNLV